MIKLTQKKMRELHQKLGGNDAGYYIIAFETCTTTKQSIRIKEAIAYNRPKGANWTYQLVKGEQRKN